MYLLLIMVPVISSALNIGIPLEYNEERVLENLAV
jgi:hypothetical protein